MEKSVTDEKKTDIPVPAVKESSAPQSAASPQAIPAIVDSSNAVGPIVLSQTPPAAPSEAKPVVDKPSSVVAPPLAEKK
jgi:hypothetical protein